MTASSVSTLRGKQPQVGAGVGGYRQLIHDVMAVEAPTTSIDEANDIMWLGWVPAGAVLVDGWLKSDALGTGTAAGFNLGDSTTTNLLLSAAATTTAAGSGGVAAFASSLKYTKFANATRLKLTTVTASQTPAGGTILVGLTYFIDPNFDASTGPGVVAE